MEKGEKRLLQKRVGQKQQKRKYDRDKLSGRALKGCIYSMLYCISGKEIYVLFFHYIYRRKTWSTAMM